MRLTETQDFSKKIVKDSTCNITIHDKDYMRGRTKFAIEKDMCLNVILAPIEFCVGNVSEYSETGRNRICTIKYYNHNSCMSQEFKRILKKMRKLEKTLLGESDDKNNMPFYRKYNAGIYEAKCSRNSSDVNWDASYQGLKRALMGYIRNHPHVILYHDVEEYGVLRIDITSNTILREFF